MSKAVMAELQHTEELEQETTGSALYGRKQLIKRPSLPSDISMQGSMHVLFEPYPCRHDTESNESPHVISPKSM